MTAWEGREPGTSRSRPRKGLLDWLLPQEDDVEGTSLPPEGSIRADRGGWTLTLPVRREHISVHKRAVAVERVRLAVRRFEEVADVRDSLQREELVVDPDDALEVGSEQGQGDQHPRT
jgi:hypothetical protein